MELQTKQGNKKITAILFDKDGTLIESDKLWARPTIEVVAKIVERSVETIQVISLEELLAVLGVVDGNVIDNSIIASGTVMDMLEAIQKYYVLDVEESYQFVLDYFREYLLQHPTEIVAIGNVKELIQNLKIQNIKVGIVTNDSFIPTKTIFEIMGIWDLFDFVGTTDEYPSKPNPTSLQAASRQLAVPLEEMAYVGDSLIDMEYARHVGVAVAVLTGGSQRAIMEERASIVLDTVEQLPNFIVKGV